jgi:hypothetical protein
MLFSEVHRRPEEHLTMEELEAMARMDPDDLSPAELRTLREISRKVDECPVCRTRYLFFRDSSAALDALMPRPAQAEIRVDELLRAKVARLTAAADQKDAAWRESLARWLTGAQETLTGAFGRQARLQSALAGAARGSGGAVTVTAGAGGSYGFSLPEGTALVLEASQNAPGGTPLCAVICGRAGSGFSSVYPLRQLTPGRPVLSTEEIWLEAGDYTLCIPTLKP